MKFLRSILLAGITFSISSVSLFANNSESDRLQRSINQEIEQCFTDERVAVQGRHGIIRPQSETCHTFRNCVQGIVSSNMSQEELVAGLEKFNKCRAEKDRQIQALLRSLDRQ